jgi:hypothetical protein
MMPPHIALVALVASAKAATSTSYGGGRESHHAT